MVVRADLRGCVCRDNEFKASQIAVALGCSTRNATRRAYEERWRYEMRRGMGGVFPFYLARRLPKDVASALHDYYCMGLRK